MFTKITSVLTLCSIPLAGCAGPGGLGGQQSPISAYSQQILSEATALHNLEMSLEALKQAQVVVMQPTPIVITPTPTPNPPVIVTPGTATPPNPNIPEFPSSPNVTPSLRYQRHTHRQHHPATSNNVSRSLAQIDMDFADYQRGWQQINEASR